MAHQFGSLVFTPAVKALQEQYGSRRQYARLASGPETPAELGPDEREFLADRDSFYIATVGETGWPYVQHRGGPKGFLKVIDERTIAFADFRGNKQYISTGNLATDDKVALILVDYPNQARLKILGHAKILEGDAAKEITGQVRDPEYSAVVERVFVIHVEAFDWNCPQHITPRFTVEQLQSVLKPLELKLQTLTEENQALRMEAKKLRAS